MSYRRLLCSLLFLALIVFTGCSSSRDPTADAESESPSSPAYAMLYTTHDATLVLHDAATNTSQTLAQDVRFDGTRASSPDGRMLAFSYATPDSTHLALLNLDTQVMIPLHARAGDATYSLAWHSEDGRLAFGYYTPSASGKRGPGTIRIATSDGSTRSAGCRAAREVLHWLPDGSLATRDDDNIYVVAPSNCATRASLDARRMYHITYAPEGRRLAYIHRELKYDRSIGEYVPDSSLFVSDPRGQNARKLFGDERQVRHLRWSPDGTELAFDARPDDATHRQVVIYNANQDRTVYLIPPNTAPAADQAHPRWSPDGSRLAFTLRNASGTSAAVQVGGQTRRLGATRGPVWGWMSDQSLVVRGPDSLRVKNLQGTTQYAHPRPETLIHAWHRPVL